MTKQIWIGNGKTVLPDGVIENGSVLLEGGKILGVNGPCPENAERVDANGGYILPGFIDMHVHGGGGIRFEDQTEDRYEIALKIHGQHGTTALAASTSTIPDEQLEETIRTGLEKMKNPPEGARVLGFRFEGPFLSAAKRGAQRVKEERYPTREFLEHILELAEGHVLAWDAAAELPGMEMFAQVMKEHGVLCPLGHSACNATQALQAFDWGFNHMTHFYNACTTFHKENYLVHSGSIEAGYIRDDVTIELIGDGCHIPRESMLLALKIKGPDRIALITDATQGGGVSGEENFKKMPGYGTSFVVYQDVAQLPDLSVYAGSIATMDRCLRTAHVKYGIPLEQVSRMLSLTPARLLKLDGSKGSLEAGKDADIVVMDKEFQVERVFVMGKELAR